MPQHKGPDGRWKRKRVEVKESLAAYDGSGCHRFNANSPLEKPPERRQTTRLCGSQMTASMIAPKIRKGIPTSPSIAIDVGICQ